MRRPPSILARKGHLIRRGMQTAAMGIDTYFGFFARSMFRAIQASITQQTLAPLSLERVELSATNTLKLRWSDVDTVILPELVIPQDIPFVLALTGRDARALKDLTQARVSLQRMMEQAVSTAIEPINFITKRRNRLSGLTFSHNVTGLTASHLDGEVQYTMATAHFRVREQTEFALRLLVTARDRDRIEDRATAQHTQRALFSIIEGAYVCSPQWEPPPPPPGAEAPSGLSDLLTHAWIQSFYAANDGPIAARAFQQPVAFQTEPAPIETLEALKDEEEPLTVVRLILNDARELETIVVLRAAVEQELMRLSKSAELRFIGDLFRALFAEAGERWAALSGQELRWRVNAVRRIPPDAIEAVTGRLAGGGFAVRQWAGLDEGSLDWFLAVPPHAWHWLMRLTARAMDFKVEEPPDREAIFQATGWGAGTVPWRTIFAFFGDRDLQHLVRQLERVQLGAPDLAAIGRALHHGDRDRWLEAMPVNLRERTEGYKVGAGENARRQIAITQALIDLNRQNRLPEGKLVPWLQLYAEFHWQRRQRLIEELLPLRHLVYGMDRASLSRLLYDETNRTLTEALCWAEFAVLDQVRRAISPGFALRMLDDVQVRRPRTSAYTCQRAQLTLYRHAMDGLSLGRYLIRETPAKRLRELIRWLDEPQ